MNLADKLDASPAIVWNWRFVLRTPSVWINAFGAALTLLLGAGVWIAPLLGVVAVANFPLGVALTICGVLFLAAVIARFIAQKGGTGAWPPKDADDNADHA